MCDVVLLGAAHIHMRDVIRVLLSHPAVRVVAVWDHDQARAARWASALDAQVSGSVKTALDTHALRGALVYSETSRHRALVQAAARQGLAVFVEKPLAVSSTDALAMSEALTGTSVFSTGFFLRYADAFARLRDLVANGGIGQARHATVSVTHAGLAQGWFDRDHAWMREPTEGGAGFFDLVVHCLDLAAWVLGHIDHVIDVRTTASGNHGSAVVRTAAGALVNLEAGWEAPAPSVQMSVTGDTTLTATGNRLLAGSTVISTGRPPDAGDAPRAWLDALAHDHGKDQPLVSLADAIDRVHTVDLLRQRWTGPDGAAHAH